MQGAKALKVIKVAGGAIILIEGAVDMMVAVNRYEDTHDKWTALAHASGRTGVASGVAAVGIGVSYLACGVAAPGCAVAVAVGTGTTGWILDWVVQQDEILGRKGFGWNY